MGIMTETGLPFRVTISGSRVVAFMLIKLTSSGIEVNLCLPHEIILTPASRADSHFSFVPGPHAPGFMPAPAPQAALVYATPTSVYNAGHATLLAGSPQKCCSMRA